MIMNKQQEIFVKSLIETANDYLDRFENDFTGKARTRERLFDIGVAFSHYMVVYSNLLYEGILGNETIASSINDEIEDLTTTVETVTNNTDVEYAVKRFVRVVNYYAELLEKETK